jgi:hypothetical protein
MSQKIVLFMTTAERTSNITSRHFYRFLSPRRIQMILWNRPGIPNGKDKIKLRERERERWRRVLE